jgi:YVTN family beta-propeller protein
MLASMSSCPNFITLLLFLMTVFLISYGLPRSPFMTSFAYSPGQAIVTSNDECEPGSLVHCIGRQPQEKGFGITSTTTSSESSDSAAGESHHPDVLGTLHGFLYVGNAKSNSVSVIDLATNVIVKNITVGKSPHDIKISDDQQTVYTTDIDSGIVSIINATSNTLIHQIETGANRAVHGIAIFNDTLYVGDVYGGKVLVIKDDGQIENEIQVGSGPEYVEASPDGKFLYVANLWSPISVVDVAQNKVIKEIHSGETPHGLSFTDDGSRLFIVNMNSNTLSVIDATRHQVIKTIPVGDRPEYVALTPDERFALVTNLGSDTVSIVDAESLQVVKEIPVGGNGPHGIAFSPDGDMAYVSNMDSSDISVINMTTGQIIATFPSGGVEPHQIILKKPSVSIASAESRGNGSNNNSTTVSIPEVYVDIANDPSEHARGLMFKKNLEWNNGMLFVFEDGEKTRSFWMKNTSIPLDMLFIDSNLTIVDIKQNALPCIKPDDLCPSYVSRQSAKFVLEVNAGFTQNNSINIDDRLVLNEYSSDLVPRDNETYFDGNENFDGSVTAVAAARQFLISKLPEVGIQLQDESMLHTDMVVAITETEYRIDFGAIDAQSHTHEGYVEVSNGEVINAELDGRTILFSR